MKKIILTIVSVLMVTMLHAAPAQAYDNSTDDSPGYVTYVEWLTEGRGTMSEIERSWGVVGIGTVVYSANSGKNIIKEYRYAKNWQCTGSVAQVNYTRSNTTGNYVSGPMTLLIWQQDPLSKVIC